RPESMEKNLNLSMGLHFSQRVLMSLIEKGMQRQQAYELVQKEAMYCWEKMTFFPDRIRQNDRITSLLTSSELDALFDPRYYLKYEGLIMDRVLKDG
ncbi:MAG: adenylosuccinate lyase, partial [Desulfonatronovibrionaceae bacterium]